jgi:phage head maturation protease
MSGIFRRFIELKIIPRQRSAGDSDDSSPTDSIDEGDIRMVASTSAPVRMRAEDGGDWAEILEHNPGNVDTSALSALLVNHDADQLAGPVRGITFDGSTSSVDANVLPDARMKSGVSVRDAIKCGALRGVSIGYQYSMSDCSWDDASRTLRVNRWRMLEATLTPIPADPGASLRSIPITLPATPATRTSNMTVPAAPAPAGTTPAVVPAGVSETSSREAFKAEAVAVAALVRSVKLDPLDFAGLTLAEAQAKALADIAVRDAATHKAPAAPVRPHIEVGEEHEEKIGKRMAGAILHGAGFRHDSGHQATASLKDMQEGNELRGRTISDQIRATAHALGIDVHDWSREHLAALAMGKTDRLRSMGKRNAANISTGFFNNFVFLNALTKAVTVGYQMGGRSIKYEPLVSRNYVPDYKTFYLGSLGTGNLQQTVENAAFPELFKSEGVYSSSLKMWGGTISLSEQALVTDDTGQFNKQLAMAGVIAKKTIDKRVFQKLMAGTDITGATSTWTNNTTAGTIVYTTNDQIAAARQNLGKVKAALMNKVGLDGNPMGNIASFLVVPATRMHEALGLVGQLAPGQQSNMNVDLQVVATPWLEFSGLIGNSATNYYTIADPNEVTGLVLSTLTGFEEPRVEQYDPGAVAAMNFKIYLPFEADLVQHTPATTGLATIAAVQQGT